MGGGRWGHRANPQHVHAHAGRVLGSMRKQSHGVEVGMMGVIGMRQTSAQRLPGEIFRAWEGPDTI